MTKNLQNPLPVHSSLSKRPVTILYEDELCVVFDKPAGLLVIPTPKNEASTLTNFVNHQMCDEHASWRLHPCHRLDRETSGAIIYAKGKKAQKTMMDLFKKRVVAKKYIAFVHGKFKAPAGEYRGPVKDLYRKKFRKRAPAADAVTAYKVVQSKKLFSVVEVRPVTGRTNQIRIHFSEDGHPLVGDRRYAFPRDYELKFRRTALHAASLGWSHPVHGKKIHIRCELPRDMAEFLKNH